MRNAKRLKNAGQEQAKRIRVPLKTAEDVRRFQARCIRRAMTGGGVGVNDSYKLVTAASMLLKSIEVAGLEERIKRLEQRTGGK